jgi:hypothetical protein
LGAFLSFRPGFGKLSGVGAGLRHAESDVIRACGIIESRLHDNVGQFRRGKERDVAALLGIGLPVFLS